MSHSNGWKMFWKILLIILLISPAFANPSPDPEYLTIVREEVASKIDQGEVSQAEGEAILKAVIDARYNPRLENRNNPTTVIVLTWALSYTAQKAADAVWSRAENRYNEVMARRERESRERRSREGRSLSPGQGPSCRIPGGRRNGPGRP